MFPERNRWICFKKDISKIFNRLRVKPSALNWTDNWYTVCFPISSSLKAAPVISSGVKKTPEMFSPTILFNFPAAGATCFRATSVFFFFPNWCIDKDRTLVYSRWLLAEIISWMWSHRSYILVQYCRRDTAREWLDTTCTTRTGRETMVYRLYRSWINGDMHIISNTALQPRQYNPYRSWNNGSRVLQLVNCIDIYILMISNSAELIRPVNDWRDKYTKDGVGCNWFCFDTLRTEVVRVVVWHSPLRCNNTRRVFSSAATSKKKFIQLHIKLVGSPFSTATFAI